jgi:hypothetical protein
MKTNIKFSNPSWMWFKNLLAALILALLSSARADTPPAAIPFSEIGAKATADYHGNALSVTATADGARLRCGFQKLEGHATPQGLWLESTEPGAPAKLRLVATGLSRGDKSTANLERSNLLPSTGTITVKDKLVEFTRPAVTEEYSVSVDGLRQDFVITTPPAGRGDLCVELLLNGARAEMTTYGVKLKLDGTGRELAYSHLRVGDAKGRELKARLEVLSPDRLAVSVTDANATYPIRIDPTFSTIEWVSLTPSGIPGTDGDVLAIAADSSGDVYVGGVFSVIGATVAKNLAKWDGSTWSALGGGIGGVSHPDLVCSLAVSGTNLYVGGDFTNAGSVWVNGIAKWDGTSWSAMASGIVGDYRCVVTALAVSETNLYAAGLYYTTTNGGVPTNCVVKSDGSAWSVLGGGFDKTVNALAASGTNLYAGGNFTMVGGVSASGVARWDGSAWRAMGSGIGGSPYPQVFALAVSGTRVYAGGSYTTPGNYGGVACWDGNTWTDMGLGRFGYNATVRALAVDGTNLYAGGGILAPVGGGWFGCMAKFDGTKWSAMNTGTALGVTVLALAVSGNTIYAGGDFTAQGTACHIAKWDGTNWLAVWPATQWMDGYVEALTVSGTNLYAGGQFTPRGAYGANIAMWNGSYWFGLSSGMNSAVCALAANGTDLFAGGYFTQAGLVGASCVAKWDGTSWSWSPLGSGVNNPVFAVAVSGTNFYAGGCFTAAGGATANRIAKWDGSSWSALGSGMNSNVYAMMFIGTNLYAGGDFTIAGGVPANHIAKWDGTSWSALGLGVDNTVYALAASGTDLYVGGSFGNAGTVQASNIAKWDGNGWSALGSGMNITVRALTVCRTDLYAAGYLMAERDEECIARWDGNTWSVLSPGIDRGTILALATDISGHLFVGGSFSTAGTIVSPCVAQANLSSTPAILTLPQSQTAEDGGEVDFNPEIAGGPIVTCLWFLDDTNLISYGENGCFALSNVNFSLSGTYTLVVTNACGAVTSGPVMLNVIPAVERRPVPGIELAGEIGGLLNVEYTESIGPAPDWLPIGTVNLTNPPQYCFDVTMPLPPQRFYRAWQPETSSVVPSLNLNFVPAITLNGNITDKLRLDCINLYGPTNAWVTLDTVTLTNTSQLYFDTSAVGQPQRLYRIVPAP